MKVFVIDVAKCNGCHNCQIVCKDEHCGVDWLPYAKAQPDTGQFWLKVNEKVRGSVPVVKVSYVPFIGAQTEALRDYAPEVLMDREDGLLVVDPEKARGRKDIAEKFEGVFWNEELSLPQGCTGCAHLLDDGWTVPRCVDSCATEAMSYIEESEVDKESAETLSPGSHVYYLNLPKRFVAGAVIDFGKDEVVIGASVILKNEQGEIIVECETDEFGDFFFNQVEPALYTVAVSGDDFVLELEADAREKDVNLGDCGIS